MSRKTSRVEVAKNRTGGATRAEKSRPAPGSGGAAGKAAAAETRTSRADGAPAGPKLCPVALLRRPAVAGLLALYFVLGGLYLAAVPFGNAPDENAHLLYVQQLAGGHLPVLHLGSGQEVRPEDRANFEAHQPPLAYLVALPAYLAAGGRAGDRGPTAASRVAVRLVDLLLGAVVILLVYAGMTLWLPHDPAAAWGAAAVAALIPMRLALSASFSNDPLTEVIFTATLLVLALGQRDGFDRRRCVLAGVFMGLGLLTKTTCVLLLPVALLALFLEWRRHQSNSRAYQVNALLLVGVPLAISAPWLARNLALYGDPLAWRAFVAFFGDRAKPEYFLSQGLSMGEYLRDWVAGWTARSFWGVFDHMNLWMGGPRPELPGMPEDLVRRGSPGAPIYTVLGYVSWGLAAGAVAAGIRGWRRRPEAWQGNVVLTWGFCGLLVLAAFARFNMSYFQAQARYLYPAILPIAGAISLGWLAPWPARRRGIGSALGVAALAALALYAWQGTLLRYFRGG